MKLKSFIIGIFLLGLGCGTLWWVTSERQRQEREVEQCKLKYGSETTDYIKRYEEWTLLPPEERAELPPGLHLKDGSKTHEEIVKEQDERLKADMDKLAAGQMTGYPFTDDFYGPNWQQKIVEYKQQIEKREFIYNVSIACTTAGGLLTGWVILLTIARLLIKIVAALKKAVVSPNNEQDEPDDKKQTDHDQADDNNLNDADAKDDKEKDGEQQQEPQPKNLPNILINSGWQYAGTFGNEQKTVPRQRKRIPAKYRPQIENTNNESSKPFIGTSPKEKTAIQKPVDKASVNSEIKKESETIIANNVDITSSKGHVHLIDTTLKDLTQQVSAIREYAANQQNRLERFQDGYDWNIIKTFCLRIIRCIDNIDSRIENLADEDAQTEHLEEVRDELIFALESSGIEQFEPEVNSDYRGQEKFAEAVKEKTECEDPDKKGKIESVLRPGYHFFIDDENVKIVRPAQVRLFA
jgi:molecular chaperone GrpE (heat shock protein)